MLKSLLIASPVVGTALYMTGAFEMSGYPRTVDGSPEQLMAELADLDIREQPGSPGSTAQGGFTPQFRVQRGAGRLDWVVTSGGEVAMTMTASFEPIDGGARTKITAWVERGSAPAERTSPAFLSEGVTLGLFHAALDTELDEMTAIGWGPECDAIEQELMGTSLAAEGAALDSADTLGGRVVGVGKVAMGLHRVRRQLLERGCNPDAIRRGPEGFGHVREVMSEGGAGASGDDTYSGDAPTNDWGSSSRDGLSDDWGSTSPDGLSDDWGTSH